MSELVGLSIPSKLCGEGMIGEGCSKNVSIHHEVNGRRVLTKAEMGRERKVGKEGRK